MNDNCITNAELPHFAEATPLPDGASDMTILANYLQY